MNNLEQARSNINRIDREMAALFEERFKCSHVIADFKMQNGLSVKDEKREQELIAKNSEYISDAKIGDYYVQFMKKVIDLSCDYQTYLMKGLKVAYSGVEGCFAHIAARRMFPKSTFCAYPDFKSAYQSVENGECDVAVLPFENSYAGEVGTVLDLIYSGSLYINQVLNFEVEQTLMGCENASVDSVKTVVSHPQALEQCAEYISLHGYEQVTYSNTAAAAKMVKEKNDPSFAAITSKEAAEIYGLKILETKINTSNSNTTRFGAFTKVQRKLSSSKKGQEVDDRFMLMFAVKNEPNAVSKAISIIGQNGYNMISLKSRPLKENMWDYYFYVECEGDISSEKGGAMLKQMEEVCGKIKLAGTYLGPNQFN